MANGTNRGGALRGEAKGVQTSTCPICGAENTRRSSLAVKGGRICKTHPEAAKIEALNAARLRARKPAILVEVA